MKIAKESVKAQTDPLSSSKACPILRLRTFPELVSVVLPCRRLSVDLQSTRLHRQLRRYRSGALTHKS